jgi:hypothetical protein
MDIMDIMDGMGRAKTMDRQRRAATAALAAMDRGKKNGQLAPDESPPSGSFPPRGKVARSAG